jgi:hypothetical protein
VASQSRYKAEVERRAGGPDIEKTPGGSVVLRDLEWPRRGLLMDAGIDITDAQEMAQ